MLRAVRFSAELDFSVSYETINAVHENSNLIKNVSFERIRDEFTKIIMSPNSVSGIILLQKLNLLKHIIPELEEGIGCIQGGAHKYDVWEHLLQALDHATKKDWPLEIRLSALFHDIGKVITEEEGSHVDLGVKLLKKYEMPQAVIDCVAQHHEDAPFSSKESILVYIADAISGSRPGARYENYDDYAAVS